MYTLRYNLLWHGTWLGLLLTCFFPITPWAIVLLELGKKGQKLFDHQGDWNTLSPGAVFFLQVRLKPHVAKIRPLSCSVPFLAGWLRRLTPLGFVPEHIDVCWTVPGLW